jgi:hypothetical protein
MAKRKLFFLSLGLTICALVFQCVSMTYNARSARLIAESVVSANPDGAKTEADRCLEKASRVWYVGLAFAVLGLCTCVGSVIRREPVPHSVPFTLLILFVLLQLIM